jgi:serine/threonine protein kinase
MDLEEALATRGLVGVEHLTEDVYVSRRRGGGPAVVLKLIPWDLGWTGEFVERRGPGLCALRHPGIARVFEFGDDFERTERSYLLREYVPGRDARARGAPFPTDLAVYVALRITEALAHACPRVGPHRRFGPSHVLLSVDGEVKLIGFEDAYTERLVHTSGEVRRPPWLNHLSPEELRQVEVDARADIFSVGACMWEWLAGRAPFQPACGWGPIAVFDAIVHGNLQPLDELRPELPVALRAIVARALAHDPADRYPRLEDLRAALVSALDCDLDLARHALAAWVGAEDSSEV